MNNKFSLVNKSVLMQNNNLLSVRCYSNKVNNNLPNIKPENFYPVADENKNLIYKDNQKKCGIYRWTNLVNNNSYVGSSTNLSKRFSWYFSLKAISKVKASSLISRALLKYGLDKFSLEILEYCESTIILEREQYYIDTLNPKHNILKVAGSSLGYKHTEETIAKFKARKFSSEHLAILKDNLTKFNSEEQRLAAKERMLKINKAKSIEVEVIDTVKNRTTIYESIRKAPEVLNCSKNTLLFNEKQQLKTGEVKLVKDRYIIKIIRKI